LGKVVAIEQAQSSANLLNRHFLVPQVRNIVTHLVQHTKVIQADLHRIMAVVIAVKAL
jgi:hypothetical protein